MSKLAIRLTVNGTIAFAIPCFCLFLPASSLDYWQAWIYLTVFFGGSIFMILYLLKKDPHLLERRETAKEQRPIQKLFQAAFALLFISLFIIAGFDRRLHWSDVPTSFVIVADGVVLLSWRMFFMVLRENSYASSAVEITDTQKVISSGPYARVRHPMYSAFLLLVLPTPIALGSWWGLPSAFLMVVVFLFRLLDEEVLLRQDLPGYDEYRKKVRYRLIPKIW